MDMFTPFLLFLVTVFMMSVIAVSVLGSFAIVRSIINE